MTKKVFDKIHEAKKHQTEVQLEALMEAACDLCHHCYEELDEDELDEKYCNHCTVFVEARKLAEEAEATGMIAAYAAVSAHAEDAAKEV